MNSRCSPRELARAVRGTSLCSQVASLTIIGTRTLSSTTSRHATPTLHPTTRQENQGAVASQTQALDRPDFSQTVPSYKNLSPAERAQQNSAVERARIQEQTQKLMGAERQVGKLASNSFFADDDTPSKRATPTTQDTTGRPKPAPDSALSQRNVDTMQLAINPNPDARARWQRKMVIRHIQHKGRLPRVMQLARTERSHLSKSHFFKTSIKKLAPLARQIAGKSIDEAILQMRFSKKKAAADVRKHLVQARDEAIVMRGMGASKIINEDSPVVLDAGNSPIEPHQNPTKSTRDGLKKDETDIYVAQSWVNRGPYGMEPEFRARGRVNMLRPPWTGISVLLKEEKTRTMEKAEKEEKSIKKRTGKMMWRALPDRPITRQSQYVLW